MRILALNSKKKLFETQSGIAILHIYTLHTQLHVMHLNLDAFENLKVAKRCYYSVKTE